MDLASGEGSLLSHVAKEFGARLKDTKRCCFVFIFQRFVSGFYQIPLSHLDIISLSLASMITGNH